MKSLNSRKKEKWQPKFFAFLVKFKLDSIDGIIDCAINRVLIESCRSTHATAVAVEEKKKMLRDQEMKRVLGAEKRHVFR